MVEGVAVQSKQITEMRALQTSFDGGQEKWRGDAVEMAKRQCETCANFRVAFQKEGVAVVWADDTSKGSDRTVGIHLYKPFFKVKGIGARSIWVPAYDEAGFSEGDNK